MTEHTHSFEEQQNRHAPIAWQLRQFLSQHTGANAVDDGTELLLFGRSRHLVAESVDQSQELVLQDERLSDKRLILHAIYGLPPPKG